MDQGQNRGQGRARGRPRGGGRGGGQVGRGRGGGRPRQNLTEEERAAARREYQRIYQREYRRIHRRPNDTVNQAVNRNARDRENRLNRGLSLFRAAVLTPEGKLRYGVPEEDYLGPMDQACTNCGALYFMDERKRIGNKVGDSITYSMCCDGGKMDPVLFNHPPYPARLKQFFEPIEAN